MKLKNFIANVFLLGYTIAKILYETMKNIHLRQTLDRPYQRRGTTCGP